jgi:DNA polymerase III subunit gamma/tau
MLSNAAFNAFLKTLEEPPSYAIFILATTEKHKVIPTILSRCQIFDFNRIQISDIANHLKKIAQREGIAAEDEALHLISQKADGALRDALSIFDLMVTYSSGNAVTYKSTLSNLHILDYDYYFQVVDALLTENHTQPLLLLDEILRKGFDGQNFIVGLSEHFTQPVGITGLKNGEPHGSTRRRKKKICSAGCVLPSFPVTYLAEHRESLRHQLQDEQESTPFGGTCPDENGQCRCRYAAQSTEPAGEPSGWV